MFRQLINSDSVYKIFQTIYEQGWSYFTLSQLIKPYDLDKGNTTRYLKKLCKSGLLSKIESSSVYLIDRKNITIASIFNLIQLDQLKLTCTADQHIFLKYEKFFTGNHLHQSRVEGAPFFLSIVCEAEQLDIPEKRGCHHKFLPYLMQNNHIDWYLRYKDLHEVTNLLFEAAERNEPTYLRDWISYRERPCDIFVEHCKHIHENLDSLVTKKDIAGAIEQLIKKYIEAMCWSSILEACRFDFTPSVMEYVSEYLPEKRAVSHESLTSILSAPTYHTYVNETELSLLRIAKDIQDNYEDVYNHILTGTHKDLYEYIETRLPHLAVTLQTFTENFFQGISFARVRSFSVEHVFNQLHQRYVDKFDITQKILFLESQPELHKTQKKDIQDSLTDQKAKNLISILDDAVALKDISSRNVLLLHHTGMKLLEKTAEVLGYNINLLRSMSYDEVLLTLHDLSIPDQEEIEERTKYSLCIQKDHRYYFYTGKEAENLYAKLLKDTTYQFTGMRGSVLTSGTNVGKVHRIEQPIDNTVLHKGDIVVASHVDACEFNYYTSISGLLIESEETNEELFQFAQKNPQVPIILHVDGLFERVKNDDIIHIDGDFGRVTILETHGKHKYTGKDTKKINTSATQKTRIT